MASIHRLRRAVSVPLLALVAAGALRGARADEGDELRALRQEIRAEREAVSKEREALAEQRRRVDDALATLEAAQAAAPSGAARLPGVSEEGARAHLEAYGFVQADAIYDVNRVDPDWSTTLRPSKIPVNCQPRRMPRIRAATTMATRS